MTWRSEIPSTNYWAILALVGAKEAFQFLVMWLLFQNQQL